MIEMIELRERLALRNKAKEEETPGGIQGVDSRSRNENVFARPNGLPENAETALSCRGPRPARKKKEVYQ